MMPRGSGYVRNGWVWERTRIRIWERDGYICRTADCSSPATSVDHVIPVAEGGSHHDSNLVSICAHHKKLKDRADNLAGLARKPRERRAPESHPGLR